MCVKRAYRTVVCSAVVSEGWRNVWLVVAAPCSMLSVLLRAEPSHVHPLVGGPVWLLEKIFVKKPKNICYKIRSLQRSLSIIHPSDIILQTNASFQSQNVSR